jgi:DNA gyrase subunit A
MKEKEPAQAPLQAGLFGRISNAPIVDEVKRSYLEYAMSVIVARALPDVRDGLKPVHRRILYAMGALGLRHNTKFRKSAHVVGEVMAKYHPHGDAAIYDSLVRMAQDFAMRERLIDGQGNFGSMDGDAAAAMRYTEARLTAIAEEMLTDIDKNTVNFVPNYDGSHNEPTVLPAKLPNLLLNGTVGIAVGMATSVPPHNLSELSDGVIKLIEEPKTTVEELGEIIKGPDFPTGGIIYGKRDIASAFSVGRGAVVVRARAEIKEARSGMYQIIVTEVPYQVNKADLLEKIATLVQEKKIEGISDLRDESDRDGLRVVVDLKKDAKPKSVLNNLYKYTELQNSFSLNMVALNSEGTPQLMNIKSVLMEYVKHRQLVIVRRSQFELKAARDRAHILEGLLIALANLDAVIETIRKSPDSDTAKTRLMERFKLSELQTIAILDMQLRRLAALERQKLKMSIKPSSSSCRGCVLL